MWRNATMFRVMLAAATLALLSMPAMASPGGGAGQTISREQAQARGARTVSRSECVATCQTRSPQPQACPNACVAPNCYAQRDGRAYCVK
jgi:hypothetical protein